MNVNLPIDAIVRQTTVLASSLLLGACATEVAERASPSSQPSHDGSDEVIAMGAAGPEGGRAREDRWAGDGPPTDLGTSDPSAGRDAAGSLAGCPEGLPGPALVEVPAPPGAPVESYCIDSTEVTHGHYDTFLAARWDGAQDPWCSWNTSYGPSGPGGTPLPSNMMLGPDYPVIGVDWCDAVAYCRWAGKHLCGKMTPEPGGEVLGPADFANPSAAEWFNACSAGGTKAFPYGDTFDPLVCNATGQILGQVPVGSSPACEGGYPGLFDLAGNVGEWEASCAQYVSADDQCAVRGGSYIDGEQSDRYRCDDVTPQARSGIFAGLGFRCCASKVVP